MRRVDRGCARYRALIISGQNNHDWRTTTPQLRKLLSATGRFDVRVTEEPSGLTDRSWRATKSWCSTTTAARWGDVAEKAVE